MSVDRTVGINLKFNSDTSQVKASLQDLKNTLGEISAKPIGNFDTTGMQQAKQAAMDLQKHLNAATNVNTGKLDLSKFSQSLKSSNQDLKTLQSNLLSSGAVGQQAFLQLAHNINKADNSIISLGTKMKAFSQTLANTAKWQLSSSMLHGFIGAVQKAYRYAQDLNKSLTDIRIVTGYSQERMADFAIEANKAAKALSTTTNEYTKASLIYFQQGLSNSEVEERTKVTINMANATGQSAEIISDQMTAVWNNFDDGSKSLEYYADVMTALGAATASSTDEIAQGLEKFAAISETVGLSYEYATTALATVTAETRQSADVVGTAFKTMFARIQGLKLGETLEDGTDLNKYSEALMAVGVNIKTSNGELKDMDTILREMAAVWETLSKDEQVALAQKVAGVRQYNQLISLMDSWDKFEENLDTAKNSEGTLKQQAQIYEESWEAASNRVQASLETIYDQLLDDKGFIKLLDGVSAFVDGIGNMIEGMGGLKSIIMLVSSIFLKSFAKEIPGAISKVSANFQVLTGQAQKAKQQMMEENASFLSNMKTPVGASRSFTAEISSLKIVSNLTADLEKKKKSLSALEIAEYETKIKNIEAAGEYAAALGKELDLLERKINAEAKTTARSAARKTQSDQRQKRKELSQELSEISSKDQKSPEDLERIKEIEQSIADLDLALGKSVKKVTEKNLQLIDDYRQAVEKGDRADAASAKLTEQKERFAETAERIGQIAGNTKKAAAQTKILKKDMISYLTRVSKSSLLPKGGEEEIKKLIKGISKIDDTGADSAQALQTVFSEAINQILQEINKIGVKAETEMEGLEAQLLDSDIDMSDIDKQMPNWREHAAGVEEFDGAIGQMGSDMEILPTHVMGVSEKLINLGNTLMQVSMAFTSLQQLKDIWSQDDLSFTEKLTQSFGALAMILPMVATAFQSEAVAKAASTLNSFAAATIGKVLKKSKDGETGAVWKNTAAWYANPVLWIATVIVGVIAAFALLAKTISLVTEKLVTGEKISTEHCDTLIEEAEKTKELANANIELSDSMEDLIEEYTKLSALGEDTTTVLSQMKDKMPELIDSYKDLAEQVGYSVDKIKELEAAGNLAFLTGDFSQFNNLKDSIDEDLLKLSAEDAKIGSINASTKLAAGMQDVHSVKNTGSKVEFTLGGAQGGWLDSDGTYHQHGAANDETDALKILRKEMVGYYKDADGLFTKGAKLTANWKNPTELVDYYEKMVKARDKMLDEMSEEQLEESDTFRELNEMINATSEAYDEAKEQAEEYIEIAGKALMAKFEDDFAKADDMEEFLAVRKEYLKVATTQYDLSDEQALAYLNEAAALSEVGNQYQLATIMAEQFNGIDIDSAQYANVSDQYYKQISEIFGDLTDTELQVAINVASQSEDIEEFVEKFELTLLETNEAVYRASADIAKKTLTEAAENGTMDLSSLLANDEFIEFLEDVNMSQLELTSKTYEQQYSIVSQYYSYVNKQVSDSMELQEEAYTAKIAQMQTELALMQRMNRERGADIAEDKNAYARKEQEIEDAKTDGATSQEISDLNAELDEMARQFEEDYGFEIDTNISEVQSELDQLFDKLHELQDKKIDMAMDWSGVDEVEGGMKKIADFSKTVKKDAEKVGDTYQLTAAQAREWLEFYPELSNIATVTSDGIVEMNAAEVDAFINGKDAELDAAIDTEIERLEAKKATLQADLEMKKKELEAAQKIANGEMDLENVSAQYIVDLRKNLTDYFIDNKADEAEAAKLALETMGLNEEQYSNLVAQASEKNAQNVKTGAEEGATAQVSTIKQVWERWNQYTDYLLNNVKPIIANLLEAAFNPNKTWKDVFIEAWDASGTEVKAEDVENIYTGINDDTPFKTLEDFDRKAVYNEVSRRQVDTINAAIKDLEDGINSISGQQDYLRALKNQDLSEYGETSISENKKDKEDKKKKLDEEAERYHEINEELDDLNRNLNKISKAKDKAFGKKKLALIDQEIAATEELIGATENYIKQAEANFNKDAAKLNAFGAQYDSSGRISNYDEMYAAEIAAYNRAIESGNEAEIEAAEKRYEDFQNVINNYEDSLNTLEEQEDQLQDYVDKVAELKLAKIEYQIELKVEIEQDSLDYIEYQLKKLDYGSFNDAEQLVFLEQKAAHYQAQGKAYSDGVQTLLKSKGLSGGDINRILSGDMSSLDGKEFTADELALIQNSIKGMQDSNLALMELNQQIRETLPASFEAWNEKIDENLEKFEYYDAVGNHFKNIIDIVGSKPLGITPDFLKEMNLVQVANKKNEIEALTQILDDLEGERAIAQANLAKAKTDEDKKYWEEMLTSIQNREAEIQQQIFTSTEQTLQQIADIYTQEIQNALDEFEKQITGSFESLEKLQEAYDRQKTLSEQYVADYKKLYELSKLSRQLEQQIDGTSSIKNKKILQELQDEINQLQRTNNQLSEYDLEVLQKKYDLKLAEIALDEAQNAKSQVRLVRNQEGNYNYVYTADESEIDNAIQNYEDKLFALQDLNETYINEMGSAFIQVQQEMVDALSKIQLQDFESYADYKKAVDDTVAYYQERMNYYSSELQKGLDYNISLYEGEYQKCLEFNNGRYASYDTFTLQFNDVILGRILQDYTSIAEYQADLNKAIYGDDPTNPSGLLGSLYNGYQSWEELTNIVLEAAGTDMTNFAADVATALVGDNADSVAQTLGTSIEDFDALRGAVNTAVTGPDGLNSSVESWRSKVWGSVYGENGILKSSSDTETKIDTLSTNASADFSTLAGAVESWSTRWNAAIQPAIDKTDGLLTSYTNLVNKLKEDEQIPDLEKVVRIVTKNVDETDYTPKSPAVDPSGNDTVKLGGNKSIYDPDRRKTATRDTRGDKKIQAGDKVWATNGWGPSVVYNYSSSGMPTEKNYSIRLQENDPGTIIKYGGHPLEIDTRRLGTMVFVQLSNGQVELIKKSELTGYDTGGYTGAWGSEGKLAMLHEKEIVLNKEDTSNILKAVSILREISNTLNLKAGQASMAGLTNLYANSMATLQAEAQDSIIEQTIQIHAEFPDATDHFEIQEAFNNLINSASQYANRRY